MDAAIEADGLSWQVGDHHVVADVDMQVAGATIQGFVGPSGSGKTTTVRLLTGVLTPSRGTARILGADPRQLTTPQRLEVGYMPQLGVLYPHLTVDGNLRFVASLYGVARPSRRISALLDLLDLGEARSRALRDCSGGMQRRVALAAALLHEPGLLFLDEPTSGLDPILRRRLWTFFGELRDEGRTLFVTTQIVSEAAMCDRVGLIADGRVIADDTPGALRIRAVGGDALDIHTEEVLSIPVVEELRMHPPIRDVARIGSDGRGVRVVVASAEDALEDLRGWFDRRRLPITLAERHQLPFDDVFVSLLEARSEVSP